MKTKQTLVTAGIVAYGGAEEVVQAAQSVAQHTKGVQLELMVLDNASPDNTKKKLEKIIFDSNIKVRYSKENLGFGKAHNLIFNLLNKDVQSKYHVVINPDITLDCDAISEICSWMDNHPDVAMVTPRLMFPDGKEQQTAKRYPSFMALLARQLSVPALKKVEEHYLMLDEDLTKPVDVQFCSGCFFVMRSDVYLKMGGFDPRYFVYVEDADITRKALQYGRAVYLPSVSVYHAWHRDTNKKLKNFLLQLSSMFKYWDKWGFRFM